MNQNILKKELLKKKIKLLKIKQYKFNFDILKNEIPKRRKKR